MVRSSPGSPPLSFSTLACPEWSPLEVVERAAVMGFDALEWRGGDDGHAGPHLSLADRRRVRDAMDARGLVAIAVTTYTDLVHPSPTVRDESVDQLLRHAEIATVLGAPNLRAFPGDRADDASDEELLDRAAETLLRAVARLAGSGISIAIEPHDAFMSSTVVAGLLARVGHSQVGAIWDAGNSWSIGERPGEGIAALGPWLRYVQVKDGIGRLPDWHLTLLGEGEVPLVEGLGILAHDGRDVPVSIEWERPWHPELPPAEEALPAGLAFLRSAYATLEPSIQEAP
jgi:sugar phosphate isomerase/epimerase